MLSEDECRQLDEQGYLLLPGLMGAELLAALRQRIDQLLEEEGSAAGSEFKLEPGARRLANLVDKGRIFEEVILTPKVLEAMAHVLGPRFKLSSLNARSANPHGERGQPLHADSSAVADDAGYWVCNSVWMLDDFTPENGATRFIPGSHRWRRLPPPEIYEPYPGECLATGKAGTVVIMNSHMWHGGTANRSAAPPPRHARVLHALGQTAAAVSETAYPSRSAKSAERGGPADSGARRSAERRTVRASQRHQRVFEVARAFRAAHP